MKYIIFSLCGEIFDMLTNNNKLILYVAYLKLIFLNFYRRRKCKLFFSNDVAYGVKLSNFKRLNGV